MQICSVNLVPQFWQVGCCEFDSRQTEQITKLSFTEIGNNSLNSEYTCFWDGFLYNVSDKNHPRIDYNGMGLAHHMGLYLQHNQVIVLIHSSLTTCLFCHVVNSSFLKSSTLWDHVQVLQTCQDLFFRILIITSYVTQYILPPHFLHLTGMSSFIWQTPFCARLPRLVVIKKLTVGWLPLVYAPAWRSLAWRTHEHEPLSCSILHNVVYYTFWFSDIYHCRFSSIWF